MKKNFMTFLGILFLFGCSCHAGSVKAQNQDEDVVKGEYLVVIDNAVIKMETAKQKMMEQLGNCEIKKLSGSIAHIIFDKDNDPGLKKVTEKLKGLDWVRSVEPNRIARISE